MNINKLLLFIFLLSTFSFSLAQETNNNFNSINQAIIRDAVGDIQVRSILTPIWTPITAGIQIYENSFIRLNSPDSIVTISLPNGSLLRLIGVGSFYVDYLSRPKNDTYQTKLLVLSGRWFYSGNANTTERMIVNTDITTSVVENGSGGGYFYNGTNEFVIRTGRGLISYRQTGVQALVLDERQVVNFNSLDGFFYPKLATKKLFENYIIFSEQESIDIPQFNPVTHRQTTQELNLSQTHSTNQQFLIAHSTDFTNIVSELQKRPLLSNEINIMQLKVLEDLVFQKRSDLLQVVMSDITTIEEEEEIEYKEIEKVPPTPVITKKMLQDINIDDFMIAENLPTVIEKEKPQPPQRPTRPTRPTSIKERLSLPQEDQEIIEEIIEEPSIDSLIQELEIISAEETSAITKQKIDNEPQRRTRRRIQTPSVEIVETPPVIENKPIPPTPKSIEESIVSPTVEIPTMLTPETLTEPTIDSDTGSNTQQDTPQEVPLPGMSTYQAPDSYFNTNPASLEYSQFEINTLQDLMDSDFASVLLN